MRAALIFTLACVAGVNAFHLPAMQRTVRVQNRVMMIQKSSMPVAKYQSSALKQTESASIVASEKKSIVDIVWNKDTKLAIYLAIWYLGNIYCKLIIQTICILLHFPHSYVIIFFITTI